VSEQPKISAPGSPGWGLCEGLRIHSHKSKEHYKANEQCFTAHGIEFASLVLITGGVTVEE
jgi:hypothetical protein